MSRSTTEPAAIPFGKSPSDYADLPMDGSTVQHYLIASEPGSGRSTLELYMKLMGTPIISGPVHTDGPEEFAQAERDAADVTQCLPNFHDTVLEATGKSLTDDELLKLLAQLPKSIRNQIEEWGLADTEVNEQIYLHLKGSSEANRV